MALKLKVTKAEFDSLDEGIRGLYEEKDGGYMLAVDGIEDVSGLKGALAKERADREKYAKQVKGWETLGKTPEEISELLVKLEEDEKKKLESKGEYDKLVAQINERHQKTISEKDKELEAMSRTLEKHLIDAAVISAISEEGGNAKLLLPHVKERVKVVKGDDGDYSVNVLLPDKSAPLVGNDGKPLSISAFVKSLKDDEVFQVAFKASGKSGSGAAPGSGGGGGASQYKITRSEMRDVRKYMAVKDAAAKAGAEVEIIDDTAH